MKVNSPSIASAAIIVYTMGNPDDCQIRPGAGKAEEEGDFAMDIDIGKKIAEHRREKGMTQEQLARALGVSAPAVSKWETGGSYPDIMMLCPLARVLGTDVDALLGYEEILPQEKAVEYMNMLIETARKDGAAAAECKLEELLHQYPNSIAMKYYGAMVLFTLEIMSGQPCPEEWRQRWKCRKEGLLQEVYASGAAAYFQDAVTLLASGAVADGEPDRAEELLKELPEQKGDSILLWHRLYLARGETEKAKEIVQKHLYTLYGQVQACLAVMMGQEMEPDPEKQLEIWAIYCKLEKIFGGGGNMSEGLAMEIFQRAGREEEMLECLGRFADQLTRPVPEPNPLLFSPAIGLQGERYVAKELRQVCLHSLMTEEAFSGIREDRRFAQAVEKVKKSLEE